MNIDSKVIRSTARLGQSGAFFGLGIFESSDIENTFILSADMANPAGLKNFYTTYPQNFFNVGIAEQNLVGVAAGLANEGYNVIASAQACFLSMRSFEQIRQYCGYMKLPLVLVGVSSGFALTYFGNTHYALEDLGLMSSIPGMVVLSPADCTQALKLAEMVVGTNKPVYIRCTGVPGLKPVYSEDFDFEIGKAIEVIPIAESTTTAIFACGSILSQLKDVVTEINQEKGQQIVLFDMHTISPIDENCLEGALRFDTWISVEEHFVSSGLGSILANYISGKKVKNKPTLHKIGVQNCFSTPGDYEFLLQSNKLDKQSLHKDIIEILS